MPHDEAVRPVYGPTNPSPVEQADAEVKRYGWAIGLRPEKEQYYRELHASVWPRVREQIKELHIRNYSIYVAELGGQKYLFSYLEYTGEDLARDMAAMAADPETQRWWKETDPCQIQLPSRKPGANWSDLEMVFHLD